MQILHLLGYQNLCVRIYETLWFFKPWHIRGDTDTDGYVPRDPLGIGLGLGSGTWFQHAFVVIHCEIWIELRIGFDSPRLEFLEY